MSTRYFAFLRAINVGGHTVKMETLRTLFVSLGCADVDTFIASGNVAFRTSARDPLVLEGRIEKELKARLGYEVVSFLRTEAELAAVAAHQPFPKARLESAAALNVGFLRAPMDAEAKKKLMALKTSVDDFHVSGREFYWLCLKQQSDSTFSNALFERRTGLRSTLRGAPTIRKMAEKYLSEA